eukprot:TRINITY_DN27566_c0_g1_i1.p1 TRINITY_DN27566_c0_g1~~TRINITY_DN27566_c0_g1_i1.p1  ORF type:complete len:424 (-),score=45.28 TRINITY_DN27566_c0_g1_i1:525-1700(-)
MVGAVCERPLIDDALLDKCRAVIFAEVVKILGAGALPNVSAVSDAFDFVPPSLDGIAMFSEEATARVHTTLRREKFRDLFPEPLRSDWAAHMSLEELQGFCKSVVTPDSSRGIRQRAPLVPVLSCLSSCQAEPSALSRSRPSSAPDRPRRSNARVAVLLLERWVRVLKPLVRGDSLADVIVTLIHGIASDGRHISVVPQRLVPDPAVLGELRRLVPLSPRCLESVPGVLHGDAAETTTRVVTDVESSQSFLSELVALESLESLLYHKRSNVAVKESEPKPRDSKHLRRSSSCSRGVSFPQAFCAKQHGGGSRAAGGCRVTAQSLAPWTVGQGAMPSGVRRANAASAHIDLAFRRAFSTGDLAGNAGNAMPSGARRRSVLGPTRLLSCARLK